jgi:cobalt-zinc-cadmium efflux system protein
MYIFMPEHEHHHNVKETSQKNLVLSIILNSLIVILEIIAGIFSNSLALISDALHNLGDLISLILSLAAEKISLWKATPDKTFGYMRTEIIVAFINSSALVLIGAYIIFEAVGRLFTPESVTAKWVIIVAGFTFIANSLSAFLLSRDSHRNLNTKTAYLHLFYDSLNSLLVVLAGVLIYFFNWTFLDPIFSIVIGVFIIKSGIDVILETVNILNEGTPKKISIKEVSDFLKSFDEVKDVHHLHIWSISSNFYALSAHVVVEDQLLSKGYLVIDKIEKALMDKYYIEHPTIQLEADLSEEQNRVIKIENKIK